MRRAAGEYTERVELLEPHIDRSATIGAQTIAYTSAGVVRARVLFVRGVNAITQTEAWQNRTIIVYLRLIGSKGEGQRSKATGTEAIDINWRIKWEGLTYQIDSQNKDRRSREVVIVANSTDEGYGEE